MPHPRTLSVVIPTYQRPEWIRRAVRSLVDQAPLPDEVWAVARDTDHPTHQAISALQAEPLPFALHRELVSEPGFIPPVKAGVARATGDLVAVMDDDAQAEPGWTARLAQHYSDPSVGAVGGRCINVSADGAPVEVPLVGRVGYVSPLGQFIGQMYCRTTFDHPVEVDFLMGGNMSFRREVAQRLEFDMELNRNAAQGYEVDIGLQVRRMGWKIVFDPAMAIRHYSAPRETVGMRVSNAESIKWYCYNCSRVTLRRLPPARRLLSLVYQLGIGDRRAPGLFPMLAAPVARKLGFEIDFARPALSGRLLAMRSVFGRN
ncbi:MAG TPA: glycosyltransferase [Polyangia bacterium]|nr:glycosyltransferase [Polyangia bacterium]